MDVEKVESDLNIEYFDILGKYWIMLWENENGYLQLMVRNDDKGITKYATETVLRTPRLFKPMLEELVSDLDKLGRSDDKDE